MKPEKIQCYQCKTGLLPGHNYAAILKKAWQIYNTLAGKTTRRAHIRSAYFGNEKIFLDNFWPHLKQKSQTDQKRHLKFLKCAIELIKYSRHKPIFEQRDSVKGQALYRFLGSVNGRMFVVQIKEDLKRDQKFLMSAFEYGEK
jgi:hypothetical protein